MPLLHESSPLNIETSLILDPQSPEFAADPYAFYQALRQHEVPVYSESAGAWLLARFDDVESVARDHTFVRSFDPWMSADDIMESQRRANWHDMPNHEQFVQKSMLETDGDSHFKLRLIILREFSRRFVEQQRSMIEGFVDQLLDRLLEVKEFDFVSELAEHVPGHIIGRALGVPDDDCPRLRQWSEDVVQYFDIDRTPERKALAERATTQCYEYLKQLINDREKRPQGDLISAMVRARAQGELNERELVSACMLLLMAGHGSTIDVLGSGLHLMLRFPEEMKKLRQQPGLIDTAVQEMFRYESPLPFFHRFASEDVQIAGQNFPAGTKFGLLYGSANRDANAFDQADVFDVKREPNRHVAFGRGAHLCLGNHLSRLDMGVIFLKLMDRTRSIELLEKPIYKPGLTARGPQSLRVRVVPG